MCLRIDLQMRLCQRIKAGRTPDPGPPPLPARNPRPLEAQAWPGPGGLGGAARSVQEAGAGFGAPSTSGVPPPGPAEPVGVGSQALRARIALPPSRAGLLGGRTPGRQDSWVEAQQGGEGVAGLERCRAGETPNTWQAGHPDRLCPRALSCQKSWKTVTSKRFTGLKRGEILGNSHGAFQCGDLGSTSQYAPSGGSPSQVCQGGIRDPL